MGNSQTTIAVAGDESTVDPSTTGLTFSQITGVILSSDGVAESYHYEPVWPRYISIFGGEMPTDQLRNFCELHRILYQRAHSDHQPKDCRPLKRLVRIGQPPALIPMTNIRFAETHREWVVSPGQYSPMEWLDRAYDEIVRYINASFQLPAIIVEAANYDKVCQKIETLEAAGAICILTIASVYIPAEMYRQPVINILTRMGAPRAEIILSNWQE